VSLFLKNYLYGTEGMPSRQNMGPPGKRLFITPPRNETGEPPPLISRPANDLP
jgi:hypothetical protein